MLGASIANAGDTLEKSAAPQSGSITLKAQDIKKIVGNMEVPKYNSAKTAAALVGKFVDFTLNHPNGGQSGSDALELSGLKHVGIFFTFKDFPGGFPEGKATYKVTTKVSKFTVMDDVKGNSIGGIQLERCKS
jgi:hypothetical protein